MIAPKPKRSSGDRKVPGAPNGPNCGVAGNKKISGKSTSSVAGVAGVGVAGMVESVVGCKWSMSVLGAVRDGVHRPGALERACAGISTKVLNERLRKLVRFGIVERRVHAQVPPRVEYRFTEFGLEFVALVDAVAALQRRLDAGGRS